jgi:hypothetical protein
MTDDQLVLRLRGVHASDARELTDNAGADATILRGESLHAGGYGDLGTKIIALKVSDRAVRAVAKYFTTRQHSHDETVTHVVEIDYPNGIRRRETVTYKAAPGQSTVAAATAALRRLPGVSEALGWDRP